MSLIRATLLISRKINRYKDEFPILYKDYQNAKKVNKKNGFSSFTDNCVKISEEGNQQYIEMVEKYLIVKKFPNSSREVVITTHNGGKYVAFFDKGKWQYRTASDSIIDVNGHVIKWEKSYF